MNVQPNTRPFSLELAQQNHPLVTRAGREAKFIAYVPDVIEHHQLIVQVNDEVVRYNINGKLGPYHNMEQWDLFLAPVGYCQGLPVFANDELVNVSEKVEIIRVVDAGINFDNLSMKWPSKASVVETRMTHEEILTTWHKTKAGADGLIDVANKAIERAILDGDCIPTVCVLSLMCDVYNKQTMTFGNSFKDDAQIVLNEYLEGLKK